MNADPNQAKAIFLEAVEKHAPEQWPAFLDQACSGQPQLRRRVEVLLQAHVEAGTAEHQAAAEEPAPSAVRSSVEAVGSVIGPYKLLQQIGEGGMGVVFLAEQTQPVQRKVALKLIKAGLDSGQVLARFEAERQALALMDHPNIAKVLDAGTVGVPALAGSAATDSENRLKPELQHSGRPYFVMELVKGVPLTKFCDERHLTPKERLELFVPVCQAVQHAHQKGIIHRDLKPSNVLVCLYDGQPVPKVIDFGVAKATGQKLTERTLFTAFGAVVGTLEYMSPEQAELNQLDTDTRSDIYSLGVLLYELLTGTTPLERKRFKEVALLEALRLIREEEPPRPSTRLSTAEGLPSIAANRGVEPKQLSSLMRGELDWIILKALEKDRERRYETANGFARDIQRYLHDEPVQACPPSAWYRIRKFVRRHKAALGTAAAALLVLLLATGGVSWVLWDRVAQRAARAQQRAVTENTVHEALGRAEELGRQAEALPQRTSREAAAAVIVWQRAADQLAQAEAALRAGEADTSLRRRVADLSEQFQKGWDQAEQRRVQAERREKLLRDLDDARMAKATWIETHHDFAGAAAKYGQAFASFGIDVRPGQADVLARQIAAEEPAVRDALIVALDDWAFCAAYVPTTWSVADLRAIARAADTDAWRQEYRQAVINGDGAVLGRLSQAARRLSLPPTSLDLLASALKFAGQHEEAVDLLRWARGRHPADFWIAFNLGNFLGQGKQSLPVHLEEEIGCYRVAVALRPEAIAAHSSLGNALSSKGQLDDAIAAFRQAIALDSKFAAAHNNLGSALWAKGQLNDAIAAFRQAIALDPKFAAGHYNLGIALRAKGQLDDAIAAFRQAITLDPKVAATHYNLGIALSDKRQLDDAIAAFRQAITLDPKHAMAHGNLGISLSAKGQLDDAIAAFRQVIELDPKDARAHNNLGLALSAKGQLDEAIAAYRQAIEIQPSYAEAHCNLGGMLARQGCFAESLAYYRLGHELGSKRPNWRYPSADWVRRAERKAAAEEKLPALAKGSYQPRDNDERLLLAQVCHAKQLHRAASRLYAEAFAADPKLAADLKAGHRYAAACAAALAASGRGTDAGKLGEQERTRLREQALDWLRADLTAWSQLLDKGPDTFRSQVRQQMQRWQQALDFAGVRDPDALAQLPEAERPAWQQLWADVEAVQQRAAGRK
jgi:serine/threonine protein kinase/Flp pilus assembly protein TadD